MRPDFSELVYSNNHYQSLSGLCEKNSIQYIHKNGKTKYNINNDNPAKVRKHRMFQNMFYLVIKCDRN